MQMKLAEFDRVEFDEAERLFATGDYSQAISKYISVIKSNEDCYPALNKLAQSYEKANNEEQAMLVYKRLIQLNPNRHKAIAKLSRILAKSGNNEAAIKGFKKAINLNAEQPDWVFIALGNELKKAKQNMGN